jgi:hypothetical protein
MAPVQTSPIGNLNHNATSAQNMGHITMTSALKCSSMPVFNAFQDMLWRKLRRHRTGQLLLRGCKISDDPSKRKSGQYEAQCHHLEPYLRITAQMLGTPFVYISHLSLLDPDTLLGVVHIVRRYSKRKKETQSTQENSSLPHPTRIILLVKSRLPNRVQIEVYSGSPINVFPLVSAA